MHNRKMTEKECKEEGLLVLDEVDRVCKLLGLKYFLAFGTLIGAVRHKGFIPWDDDLDIWMKRHDFEILRKEFNNYSQKGFKLVDWDNDPHFTCSFPKIVSERTKVNEKHFTKKHGYGIWVDVFVLDYVNDESKRRTDEIITLDHRKGLSLFPNADISMKLGLICSYIFHKGTHLSDLHTPISYFVKEIEKIHKNEDYAPELRCPTGIAALRKIFKSEWFDKAIYVQFEDRKYPIPSNFDEILRVCYGDYMKIPTEREQNKCKHITSAEWVGNEI